MKHKKAILIVCAVVAVYVLVKLPSNFWSLTMSQKLKYLTALGANAGNDGSQYT